MVLFGGWTRLPKVKVKLPLCLIKHHARKTEWRYSSTHSLTSALDGGEWSASRPSRFTPREGVPATRWIGGWLGSRASLDMVSKRKIPSPRRESNSDHPTCSQSLYRQSHPDTIARPTLFFYCTYHIVSMASPVSLRHTGLCCVSLFVGS
jgi:hypothetical protein